MYPRDWLHAYIAAAPSRPVDPLRLQKGLFLLAMDAVIPRSEAYAFEPYAYGPMSRALYRDLRTLVTTEAVTEVPVDGVHWRAVQARPTVPTPALQPGARGEVTRMRDHLDNLTFTALLEMVYGRYPEYAVKSVFRA